RSAELAARIRRVLRRVGDFSYTLDPLITVDDYLQVDFPERKAIVNQQAVNLTPIESRLLYILMRNAGHTVTNHFLLNRAWPTEDAYEDRLHTHIYRLRRKIEPNPKEPKYVISQWGSGYTFPAPNHP
ncbi:MAG TPA: response regulator transcription factor, partial [Anaerolineae bacterium]|nr:response regulator transcription factor [Anaerolineae bacterium]